MPHVSFRGGMLKHNPRARNCSKKILRENWRAVPAGGVLLLKSHSFKQTSLLSVAQCRTEPLEDCDGAAYVARKPTWMCALFGAMDPRKTIQKASVVTLSK